MVLAVIYGVIVLLSFLGTKLMVSKSMDIGLVDTPNQRSSHSRTIPKGGGLIFFVCTVIALLALNYFKFLSVALLTPLLISCSLFYIIGWLDDRIPISPVIRLVYQILVSIGILVIINMAIDWQMQFLFLPSYKVIGYLFGVLYISWFINLYNFMDGADGIAAGCGMVGCLGLALIAYQSGSADMATIYVGLAASLAGFLYFNWCPAKIFMGDAGAYFLGCFIVICSILARASADISLYSTIIIFGLLIVDASYTTFGRFLTGRNPLKPHRQFAFHKLIDIGWNHSRVACLYIFVILFWLLPLAYVATFWPKYDLVCLLVAYGPLIYFEYFIGAAKE